jgi:hypothetical protein
MPVTDLVLIRVPVVSGTRPEEVCIQRLGIISALVLYYYSPFSRALERHLRNGVHETSKIEYTIGHQLVGCSFGVDG